jgi:AraC-like DNA-binding protein
MNAPALQRTDPLVPLPGLLAELGVPLDRVLDGTPVTAEDLVPGRYVAFGALLDVLSRSVALTGREDLGVMLGRRIRIDSFGPVGRIMRSAATLGQALADLTTFQRANSSGASAYLHQTGDHVFLGYGLHDPRLSVVPSLHDLSAMTVASFIRELTGGAVRPLEFLLIRPAPQTPADWSALGAPVRFGQAETGILLRKADMAFALPAANGADRRAALQTLWPMPAFAGAAWTMRTRHCLRSLLLEGRSGMPEAAASLGVQPRTLRRMLAREGAKFESLKDSVREAIAHDLLALTPLSVGDMAVALDYATPSAFIHAFRRWTGETPAVWRGRNGKQPGAASHDFGARPVSHPDLPDRSIAG